MDEQIFYRYNPWWDQNISLKGVIERPLILGGLKKQLITKSIVFLMGLRRVGKTTLMKILINDLIVRQKIDPRRVFYFSLDDYITANKSILEIVDEYRKIHGIPFKQKIWLFLDEITSKVDFELQLKNLYDQQNVKIFASSSSASILRSKKSFLTGRHVVVEVQPLDFEEYLQFKKLKPLKSDQALYEKHFEDFMQTGGIPEYVLNGDIEYLKELVDDIIQKDIAAFYHIKKPQVLKDFFLLLMERAGKVVSINKIANILKISPDTAKRYLKMFADTFLIYLIDRCGKTNARVLDPKKVYAADLGIRTLFTGFRDKGSLFENYVFLKLKDKNPCYLYKDGNEIDFQTYDKALIEVKYKSDLNPGQLSLFNSVVSNKKMVIKNVWDLKDL